MWVWEEKCLGRAGRRPQEGGARGISPSCLRSYLFWEVKRPSIPDLPVQRGRMNYSITRVSQGRNETWEKSCPGCRASSQRHPPLPKAAAPLMLHTSQACPNPESFPAASPPGGQPLGPALPSQNNLRHLGPRVIRRSPDVWGSGPH